MARPQLVQHNYGVMLPVRLTPRQLEAYCFVQERSAEYGGLGKYRHWREMVRLTWPHMLADDRWNPWLEQQMRSLCDDAIVHIDGATRIRVAAWSGCATSGKTFGSGLYAVSWWLADPIESAVILCTTSKGALRRRVWPVIQDFYHTAEDGNGIHWTIGNLVDSKTQLQCVKGDDKHAIFAVAVEQGETQKAVGLIKGIHTPRVLLIIDEADSTPEAIMAAIPNLRKSCRDFTLLVIGNSVSHLDPHGQVCEPADGWRSIVTDDTEWFTKGVAKWHIPPGLCLHFDGWRSPNVAVGHTKWPFLYTYEDYKSSKERADYARTVEYWQMERGFWPPEGVVNRLLTDALLTKYGTMERVPMQRLNYRVAGLDPAFGGNICALQFADVGYSENGRPVVNLTDTVDIEIDPESPHEAEYQIAMRVRNECENRQIQPHHLALDSTGTGRGVAAVLATEWDPSIQKINFGGDATDRHAGQEDPRASREAYDRLVTELWFAARDFVTTGILHGLSEAAAREFCSRDYIIKNKKYRLSTKDECKRILGHSPDHADAVVVLIELVRRLGVVPTAATGAAKSRNRMWRDAARRVSRVYDNLYANDYS